ncbi:hypothetical protein BV20DRAFT_203943 [Pilatotrama ljubarskyi]|nr:hypothetical protein BV20DRAFT_203943 [Pilatotrama ljubarskyi]
MHGVGQNGVHSLVEPPPPSFLRTPPHGVSYGSFEPLQIPALGQNLEDGFITTLPASLTQPHPFSTHDVMEEDWMRFLGDLKRAGSLLILKDMTSSNVAPAARPRRGILSGLATYAIESQTRNKRPESQDAVHQLVQYWNQRFFQQRRMEAILSNQARAEDHGVASPSSTSGRPSSGGLGELGEMGQSLVAGRFERRAARREERFAGKSQRRRATSREPRVGILRGALASLGDSIDRSSEASGGGPWYLVVRYKP